jgi:hypothetical protein
MNRVLCLQLSPDSTPPSSRDPLPPPTTPTAEQQQQQPRSHSCNKRSSTSSANSDSSQVSPSPPKKLQLALWALTDCDRIRVCILPGRRVVEDPLDGTLARFRRRLGSHLWRDLARHLAPRQLDLDFDLDPRSSSTRNQGHAGRRRSSCPSAYVNRLSRTDSDSSEICGNCCCRPSASLSPGNSETVFATKRM